MQRHAALFFTFTIALLPTFALAQVSITPAVVDLKGGPRDILKQTLHITNTSDHLVELYPRVDDTDTLSGDQTFERAHGSDELADSFANWIELSRGVIKLSPGEERDVPFTVSIHSGASAGEHHARISFASGATRDDAERSGPVAEVTVNLEVVDDAKEILQIKSFSSDSGVVFTGDDVLFRYHLENVGNRAEQPTGEIRIYDRRGREVASVDVNKDGRTISPDQTSQLASAWSAADGFGKFKAAINVRYGRAQTASVQDIAYFWIIPWKQLLMALAVALVALLVIAFYFHRWLEERHFVKLAAAGLLKAEALVHFPHLGQHPQATAAPSAAVPAQAPASPASQGVPAEPKKRRHYFKYLKYFVMPFTLIFSLVLSLVQLVRGKKKSDEAILDEIEAAAHASAPVVERQQPEPASPHAGQGGLASHGGTIDLKRMGSAHKDEWHVAPSASSQHGSVINLKDKT